MHPIAHAQARPDHPAIIMAASGETVSYRQLDETANRFAHLLRSRGIGAGGRRRSRRFHLGDSVGISARVRAVSSWACR